MAALWSLASSAHNRTQIVQSDGVQSLVSLLGTCVARQQRDAGQQSGRKSSREGDVSVTLQARICGALCNISVDKHARCAPRWRPGPSARKPDVLAPRVRL